MSEGKIVKKKSTTFSRVYGRKVHVVTERNSAINQFVAITRNKEKQLRKIMG